MGTTASFQDVVKKVASVKKLYESHQRSLIAAADICERMKHSDLEPVRETAPKLAKTIHDMTETCTLTIEAINYLSAVFSNDHDVVPFLPANKIIESMAIITNVEASARSFDVFFKNFEFDMEELGVDLRP
ncbi:hypothetical protein [Sulfitobacter sp. R18_1]|uniref:hypothetical protein n=1 Tax=Sulfitobacter sp. R18_1 TaxID=2821104 RepID=UPI001ADC3449|nr:hypothetical protein [Sulfitobacter sp. R18_1]MBO9428087.1 hypothetical protein [Sulfitobacter sp. R18_1]